MIDEPVIGNLYAHVPFCAKKCAYCAFYSEASSGELINRYVAALVRELAGNISDPAARRVFLEMDAVREVLAGAAG